MDKILFVGYEMITMLFPFLTAFLIFNKIYRDKGVKRSLCTVGFIIAFAVYIGAVFHFTGAGTLYHACFYGLEMRQGQINLIPFADDDIDIIAYIQNILLFIPLGFMLPILWPQFNQFSKIVLAGFSFSLWIEMSQLLNNRRTDIDDLILNTLGAMIGFAISRCLSGILKNIGAANEHGKYEPVIYIAVMFLGRFLLFHEIGLAKVLYGF